MISALASCGVVFIRIRSLEHAIQQANCVDIAGMHPNDCRGLFVQHGLRFEGTVRGVKRKERFVWRKESLPGTVNAVIERQISYGR
jgi:hypothetical protein